jgi:hydroxyacylglutathione hydrolase
MTGGGEARIRRFVLGFLQINAYVVSCEATREAMVIDPAGRLDDMLRYVEAERLRVRTIAVTHMHPDHITGVGRMKRATGARLLTHPEGEAGRRGLMVRLTSLGGLLYEVPRADAYTAHDAELPVGELRFRTLHTPGHSPCGICIVGEGVVFTGDTLLAGSVGRSDIPGASLPQLRQSLRDHLMPLPGDTRIFPGHGPESTIGEERRSNPFLQMFKIGSE